MKHSAWVTCALFGLFGVTVWARLSLGSANISDAGIHRTLMLLRAQTVAVVSLAGAGLAVAGLLMQGLFRNPLAEPGILGVGAGANLGGLFALALGEVVTSGALIHLPRELYLALGALLGAVLALMVLLLVTRASPDSVTVLLTGVVLSTLLGSVAAVVRALYFDKWELSRAILTFSMGDLSGKGVSHILIGVPLVTAGVLAAYLLAPQLDLLSSGEEEAATLGVDVGRLRFHAIAFTALLVAAAVAIGGGVPFIGLLVPHLIRGWCGHDHERLVPLCALGGAILLLICDCLSVGFDTKNAIPLGGITGLLGAPLFLALLLRQRTNMPWSQPL